MIKTSVTLSENQIRKVKRAYEQKTSVSLRLSYKLISGTGKYELLLTEAQKERLDKNKKIQKGVTLQLSHTQ